MDFLAVNGRFFDIRLIIQDRPFFGRSRPILIKNPWNFEHFLEFYHVNDRFPFANRSTYLPFPGVDCPNRVGGYRFVVGDFLYLQRHASDVPDYAYPYHVIRPIVLLILNFLLRFDAISIQYLKHLKFFISK